MGLARVTVQSVPQLNKQRIEGASVWDPICLGVFYRAFH